MQEKGKRRQAAAPTASPMSASHRVQQAELRTAAAPDLLPEYPDTKYNAEYSNNAERCDKGDAAEIKIKV